MGVEVGAPDGRVLLGEAVLVGLGVYLVSRRWAVEAMTLGPPPDRYA